MTSQSRGRRRRPHKPHADTGARPLVFPARDTEQSLFRGWQRDATRCSVYTDGHAESLRMWRDLGTQCPGDWYVVRCRIAGSRRQALSLLVEMNAPADRPDAEPQSMLRTLWWTPSREHAREVARQLREQERCMYMTYASATMPLYRGMHDGQVRDLIYRPHIVVPAGDWIWDRIPVEVQVYQRIHTGPNPRLISLDTVEFLHRPRAR